MCACTYVVVEPLCALVVIVVVCCSAIIIDSNDLIIPTLQKPKGGPLMVSLYKTL